MLEIAGHFGPRKTTLRIAIGTRLWDALGNCVAKKTDGEYCWGKLGASACILEHPKRHLRATANHLRIRPCDKRALARESDDS